MAKKKTTKKKTKPVRPARTPSRNRARAGREIKIMFRGVAVMRTVSKNKYQIFIVDDPTQGPVFRQLNAEERGLVANLVAAHPSIMKGNCLSNGEFKDGFVGGFPVECIPDDCVGGCNPIASGRGGRINQLPDPNREFGRSLSGGRMVELVPPPFGRSVAAGCSCPTIPSS